MGRLPPAPGLAEHLAVVRRRAGVVVACALAAAALGALLAARAPVTHVGIAEVRIAPLEDPTLEPSPRELAALAVSRPTTDRVLPRLSGEPTAASLEARVSAASLGGSRIIRVRAEDASADRAALLANLYAEAFLDYLGQDLERRGLGDGAVGVVLQPAALTEESEVPAPWQGGLTGLVLGAGVGVGGAFLRDRLDRTVRDERQARRAVGWTVPVLGELPVHAGDEAVTLEDPGSPAARAHGALAAQVRFRAWPGAGMPRPGSREPGQPRTAAAGRAVAVGSAADGEGRTTVAVNLAIAAAQEGLRVVLVDADARRPDVAAALGRTSRHGLADVLSGAVPLENSLLDVGVPGLEVLPGVAEAPEAVSPVASTAMATLDRRLRDRADLVVYDTAALVAVPETLELLALAELVLWVVRTDASDRDAVATATRMLAAVEIDPIGLVVNGGADPGSRATEVSVAPS